MRPLNVGETLDAAINIVRRRWKTLAAIVLVVVVPIQILSVLIVLGTTDTYDAGTTFASVEDQTTYDDESAFIAGQLVIFVLYALAQLLGTVACYRAVADTYLQRPTDVGTSLRFAGRRILPTLWLTLLIGVPTLIGFGLCLAPGVWLAVAWSVALPAMLVEDLRGTKAMRRSFSLVEGRWWTTFARLAIAMALVWVTTQVFTSGLAALAAQVVDRTSLGALLLVTAGEIATSALTIPLVASVTALVYFDLRVRKEGFDLALLAERLGGAPVGQPAFAGAGAGAVDAFGNPGSSVPPPSSSVPPPAPRAPQAPDRPERPAPPSSGGWAPPQAPDAAPPE